MRRRSVFDAAYYERFYGSDPVHTRESVFHLAAGVHSLAMWWGLGVSNVLDIGAGCGYWRDWYAAHHPGVTVLSTDASPHACETYGHVLADISTWRPGRRFDLVVCHGVLHYLGRDAAAAAIENIAAAARGLLYLEAPTARDLETVVDPGATDLHVTRRSAAWYRGRLGPHFEQIGAGLWVSRSAGLPLYELEKSR